MCSTFHSPSHFLSAVVEHRKGKKNSSFAYSNKDSGFKPQSLDQPFDSKATAFYSCKEARINLVLPEPFGKLCEKNFIFKL